MADDLIRQPRARAAPWCLGVCALLLALGSAHPAETVRNLVLVIGDGMGPQQVGLLEDYARNAPRSIYRGQPTALGTAFDHGVVGLVRPHPHDTLVGDSACGASQLASGVASRTGMIGLDHEGNPVETILEKARRRGKSTGLVSDGRLTGATLAAFATHVPHRANEDEIARQLSVSGVDVLLAGGLRHWIPSGAGNDYRRRRGIPETISLRAERRDERDLIDEVSSRGYRVVFDRSGLAATTDGPLVGLFSSGEMRDGIQESRGELDEQPTLAQMTRKALLLLAGDDDGFLLVVEAGQVDSAGHDNDAGRLLHEMIRLDRALAVVLAWARDRDDTLVVVTADHETGGFGFSYSGRDIPPARELPGSAFEGRRYQPLYNFGAFDVLDRLHAQRKSFGEIFEAYDDGARKGPVALARLVNANTEFRITREDAQRILRREKNPFRTEWHKYLSAETVPAVRDFKEFYPRGERSRRNLLARAVAGRQQVVWATSTHTHTPVPVVALGPGWAARRFSGLLHQVDVGRRLIEVLLGTDAGRGGRTGDGGARSGPLE